VPEAEQARNQRQGVAAKPFGIGRTGKLLDTQQISFEMSPAELGPAFVVLQVGSKAVTAENPWKNGLQQVDQHLGTAAGSHREEDE
jgi:hypothetical protein